MGISSIFRAQCTLSRDQYHRLPSVCRVPAVFAYHQHTEPSHLIAALFMVLTISLQGSISPLLCPCVMSLCVLPRLRVVLCPSPTSPGINITPWSAMVLHFTIVHRFHSSFSIRFCCVSFSGINPLGTGFDCFSLSASPLPGIYSISRLQGSISLFAFYTHSIESTSTSTRSQTTGISV